MFGTLIKHGAEPYDFDPDNSDSYCVLLSTSFGEKTIWGVGLEDALNSSGCKVGDNVSVIHNGKEPVKVPITKKDESGNKITVFVTKERNSFVIKPKTTNSTNSQSGNRSNKKDFTIGKVVFGVSLFLLYTFVEL